MTPGARLAAAAEILTEIFARKAAADRTIAAWGKAHRFAGSKDRAAIADRVYQVLRRRNECAYALDGETPRALILGSLRIADGIDAETISALCTDGTHALGALSEGERSLLTEHRAAPPDQPWIRLNYPAWLHDELTAAFGANLEEELSALSSRAPLDLRVNTLKGTRDQALRELEQIGLTPALLAHAPNGLRLDAGGDAKITVLPAYREGRIEIQDEASQRAVDLAAVRPGDTVIDLAAGAGGKTLALAAAMNNRGHIFACDVDPGRLHHMEPRVSRSGTAIVDIVGDPYSPAIVSAAGDGADIVFIDAPCSSTGTWRRNPEAKWTLDQARLNTFRAAQAQLLQRASELVKPAGRIVYAVCSVLPSEGKEQVAKFAASKPVWQIGEALRLTPARDNTDGFFAAVLQS